MAENQEEKAGGELSVDLPTDDHVLVSTSPDGVRTIRLNRPASRNALSVPLRAALMSALAGAAANPEVRCVVLRGDRRAFCAGGDVKSMNPGEAPLDTVRRLDSSAAMVRTVYDLPKPVIAGVEGPAVGAGLSLALACDIVVAADGATFGAAFVKRGLVPDTGLTHLLARSIGVARTKYLVMTGETFGAAAAAEMGIVAVHCSAGEFEDRLGALAASLASGATGALGLAKRMLNRALEIDLESALTLEAFGQAVARTTEDHRASVRAFTAKEPPRFTGR
ncbi:MAG: 2-(1,2-epoxy,2-dihydrophenyl)acetyl-CoA isomerase [Frankiales bacterium]|nr:2-(1,2-epoxy,2-dihydrophenyl)acetyl-CoA isomerase [Frankiales bacterium]